MDPDPGGPKQKQYGSYGSGTPLSKKKFTCDLPSRSLSVSMGGAVMGTLLLLAALLPAALPPGSPFPGPPAAPRSRLRLRGGSSRSRRRLSRERDRERRRRGDRDRVLLLAMICFFPLFHCPSLKCTKLVFKSEDTGTTLAAEAFMLLNVSKNV